MATAGDEVVPSESGGAGEKFQNSIGTLVQGETAASISATSGISELEQTFTRFKTKNPATMEDIPDELLINIFIRLLARQVAQMRSVSKSWNGLLSDPFFVKSHLHHSICNNNHQVLLVFPNSHGQFTEYSCESPHLKPINFVKHTSINLPLSRVIGSVNGLICLSESDYSNIHIWNPSLSAMSAIPPPHSLPPLSHYNIYMWFEYDPKTDDYKLIKISSIRNNKGIGVKEWLGVEVYSMRKGCWEFITQPFPPHITWISNTDYLCADGYDGHLHWEAKTGLWTSSTILAFDFGSETFREIPLPDSIINSNHKLHIFGVLDGKLCEMSWNKDGGWEVWVMEEYGVSESWAKRHILSQFISVWSFPYGFTSRNELLFQDGDSRLVLYDPIANKTKSTPTQQKVSKIVEYMDSLVWV